MSFAPKLKITRCHTGVENKLAVLQGICEELGIGLQEVAYIGDDLNDIAVLKAAGISACPANAPDHVKRFAGRVMSKNGGDGVFREFVEGILAEAGVGVLEPGSKLDALVAHQSVAKELDLG